MHDESGRAEEHAESEGTPPEKTLAAGETATGIENAVQLQFCYSAMNQRLQMQARSSALNVEVRRRSRREVEHHGESRT